GRASAPGPGGKPRSASEAALVPVAPYASAWVEALVAGRSVLFVDPRLDAYVRRAKSDADGRFEFRDVPPGAYHLVATVTWEVPRCFTSSGGAVMCLSPEVHRKVLSRTVMLRDGTKARVSMED
ncbi:MAG: carboxypeptidase-like regulatory domain-containing protein, partial [Anaeromyxobacteraceae bacterium]